MTNMTNNTNNNESSGNISNVQFSIDMIKWVCCDTCGKWRCCPNEVELPEGEWFCKDNYWDSENNSCNSEMRLECNQEQYIRMRAAMQQHLRSQ